VGDGYPAGHPVEVNSRTWSELGRIAAELKLAMPALIQGR
jgi:hypothetical protein